MKYAEPESEKVVELFTEEEIKAMVIKPVFDIESARAKINAFLEGVDKMVSEANAIVIQGDKDNEDATALGTSAMTLYNKIEEAKEAVPNYKEAKEYVAQVNNFAKMLTEKLHLPNAKTPGDTVVRMMKAKISQWTIVREAERRKQEKLAQEEIDKLNKRLADEAKASGTTPVKAVAPIIPKGQGTVRTETGKSAPTHIWTFDFEGEGCDVELPRKLVLELMPMILKDARLQKDLKLGKAFEILNRLNALMPYIVIMFEDSRLRKAVKDGMRNIEGVHIWEKVDTKFYTK